MLLWVGGLYGAYTAALIALQGHFIYPFQDRPFSSSAYERIEVPIPDADPLPVYRAQGREGAPVVVYFMGNVGALDFFLPMLEHHRGAGRTVIAMTYRGGGGTPGTPSEARLKADALGLYDGLLRETPNVVLHGYSLGTGLALHVAARRQVSAVVLSAPYARLCELMARAAKVPACSLPGVQSWKSADDLEGISAPVLILHGEADTLIPPNHSARLAEAMERQGIAVTRRTFAQGTHSHLMGVPGYLEAMDAFIADEGF